MRRSSVGEDWNDNKNGNALQWQMIKKRMLK